MKYTIPLAAALSAALWQLPAQAADLEVIHWWTSGGEQAAVSVLAREFDQLGADKWKDSAIAQGENARAVAYQRIFGGTPPGAAQFNTSRQFEELINAGLLQDLSSVADKEQWASFIRPPAIFGPCQKDGKVYCVPVNLHSEQWIWVNRKVYQQAGVTEPTTWQDFLESAPKIKAAGFIPLAQGGQPWQEFLLFRDMLLGMAGKDVWYQVWRDKNADVAGGSAVRKVFETMGELRQYTDQGMAGRNWNDTTNLVITGKAAAQVMGDWARGEFVLAGKQPGEDYDCIPGPSPEPYLTTNGDVFIFPKQKDPAVTQAQFKLASMLVDARVQTLFNNAKGSLPIRDDVDMSLADACIKKGLALLKRPDAIVQGYALFITPDTRGQIEDLLTEYWSTPDMTVDAAQQRFVEIIGDAD
ncbi:ABC transporter substrate-binding protein [Pokkaliibacter plantistimulans]|uniref:Probable sugar-binding periplasmic protein n=1 Tax=Pokkaliibacter plantistimulans TaxID=1635171 RepID=A0ABX5LVS3_9GAMM|nr:ABC transporter substrate-binding protein [Pokkaliibacter plantistimulans]PXF29588.1 ABC transporter substrate-binding protein [Pokkaliibacter plantistimulans]